MKRFRLVLVRHGYSLGNQLSLFSGWSDVPLTDRGRAELRDLRRAMDYPETCRYFSSDLLRCRETFHLLYGGDAELDGLRPEFRELHFGMLENQPGTQDDFARFFREWLAGKSVAGAESYREFSDRVMGAIVQLTRECLSRNEPSATVVTHSAFIRTALMYMHNWPPDRWPSLIVPNGLGAMLELDCSGAVPKLCNASPILHTKKETSRPTGG